MLIISKKGNDTNDASKKSSFSKTSCASLTWWSLRGGCTRSLSEHGRETPLRQWYFVSRRGRVGRCQVCKSQLIFSSHKSWKTNIAAQAAFWLSKYNAGWSSPVARQAHNLKAAGSNPAPATKIHAFVPSPSFRRAFLRLTHNSTKHVFVIHKSPAQHCDGVCCVLGGV